MTATETPTMTATIRSRPGALGVGRAAPRVALLYTPLSALGGGERQVLEEYRWLRKRGIAATVFTFELERDLLANLRLAEGAVRVLRGRGTPRRMRALRRALHDGHFDVLIAHSSVELAWLAARRLDTVTIAYASDPPWYRYACDPVPPRRYRKRFGATVERFSNRPSPTGPRRVVALLGAEARHALGVRALRAADAVVVLSNQSSLQQRELHDVAATVVRGCLERANEPRPGMKGCREREPIVLSVSRLVPVKLVDRLIRAFVGVRAEEPAARLLVVGTGPEAQTLRALVAALGLGEVVELVGHVADEELSAIYASAAVFAAPTHADYNIAPYEALAHGCKVVWARQMQHEQALERDGWVHPTESSPDALARAIVRALQAQPRGRPDLSHMTWAARAERVEALCRAVAGEGF